MRHKEKILEFLRSNAPETFSNSDIRSSTQVKPHQQVFQITRILMSEGSIHGRKHGRVWHFWAKTE